MDPLKRLRERITDISNRYLVGKMDTETLAAEVAKATSEIKADVVRKAEEEYLSAKEGWRKFPFCLTVPEPPSSTDAVMNDETFGRKLNAVRTWAIQPAAVGNVMEAVARRRELDRWLDEALEKRKRIKIDAALASIDFFVSTYFGENC